MTKALFPAFGSVAVAGLLVCAGCSKASEEIAPAATPPTPKAAASQLQQAFTGANPEIQNTATAVSEAMRTANYEQAVQSLQAIRARKDLTLEQGTAVYNSEMALEASLIAGVNAGDPNAKRAYELLKKSRRN
jgi:hypothetical protein